jgi:hypothetical protein
MNWAMHKLTYILSRTAAPLQVSAAIGTLPSAAGRANGLDSGIHDCLCLQRGFRHDGYVRESEANYWAGVA